MSNIHGFEHSGPSNRRPQRNENNSNGFMGVSGGFQGFTLENIRAVETHKVIMLSGRQKVKNPRQEHYGDMLHSTCCPVFKCLSFTTFILLIELALFITEVSLGLQKDGQFLEVDEKTLIKLGANSPRLLRQGEVWRLITAAVLHADFMHFLCNTIGLMVLCSRVEFTFGAFETAIIFFVSAIGGNLFSAVCSFDTLKVGASTSLFGLVSLVIGYIIINWNGLDLIGPIMKCQLVCLTIFMLLFVLVFSSVTRGGQRIDYYGHLGGFLTGLWLSAIHETIVATNRERNLRIIALVLLVIQLIICFAVFYTMM